MKFQFAATFTLLVIGVSSQNPDEICKSCEYGVGVFFGHLRERYGVAFQVATLSRDVCPKTDHPFRCDYAVGIHWTGLNHVIYSEESVPYICAGLTGLNCTTMMFDIEREFTCHDCMRDVTLLAEQYTYPAVINALTDYLKGDGYCQDPALGLNMYDITSCQENLDGFMGPALRALGAAYSSNSQWICHFWYKDICPEPEI